MWPSVRFSSPWGGRDAADLQDPSGEPICRRHPFTGARSEGWLCLLSSLSLPRTDQGPNKALRGAAWGGVLGLSCLKVRCLGRLDFHPSLPGDQVKDDAGIVVRILLEELSGDLGANKPNLVLT